MPCSGPSQEFAYRTGDEAYERVMELLKKEFHIFPPAPEDPHPFPACDEHFNAALDQLREAVREVIWCDTVSGF